MLPSHLGARIVGSRNERILHEHMFCSRLTFVNHPARSPWSAHSLTPPRSRRYSMRMDYTQLFRNLREARGLTLEQLASAAQVHRNTVVNIESGRPVKFKTIALLMQQMGHAPDSPEMKSIALLWLEAVSGIPFSHAEPTTTAVKAIATFRGPARLAAQQLAQVAADAGLSPQQIELLIFAAQHPDVIGIIENVRDFAQGFSVDQKPDALLEAAEDPGSYGEPQ